MSPPATRRKLATGAIVLALVVSAFEGTVVTTAMPTIAADLGGSSLYPWVFAAFLMASTLGVLVFGRHADARGRRPVFLVGMGFFLAGTAMSGLAWSVPALVAFRVIQGFGAGAIHPIAMTISSDLYSIEERVKVQGVFTSVWGLSNLVGPALGSLIVTHTSWRWAFLVNVPVGLLAATVLALSYVDPPREARAADAKSAWTLGLAAMCALVALEPRSRENAWITVVAAVAAGAGAVLLVARERRAARPLIEPRLFADPVVRTGFVGGAVGGAVFYATSAYLPLYVEEHTDLGALGSATALTALLVGWAVGSTAGVRVYLKHGLRATIGGGLSAFGIALLLAALAAHEGAPWLALPALFVAGAGVGPTLSTSVLGPQSRAHWSERGTLTSSLYAVRTLGGAAMVAAAGGLGGDRALLRIALIGAIALVTSLGVLSRGPGAPAPSAAARDA
ncbi:MAG: MFS transporter [Polyangiaceae bacterium]